MPQESLVDPLSEVTRKVRRSLLGVSTVGIAIAQARLVPTQITALGITFETDQQRRIYLLLAAIVFYFTVEFFIFAFSDFIALHYKQIESRKPGISSLYVTTNRPLVKVRFAFDFYAPILISLASFFMLLVQAFWGSVPTGGTP